MIDSPGDENSGAVLATDLTPLHESTVAAGVIVALVLDGVGDQRSPGVGQSPVRVVAVAAALAGIVVAVVTRRRRRTSAHRR